jgi:poly(3-hydroxybutyrate) depolymerase
LINSGYLPLRNDKITISGTGAGGGFAMQLYLAHSKVFSGIAVFSGGNNLYTA